MNIRASYSGFAIDERHGKVYAINEIVLNENPPEFNKPVLLDVANKTPANAFSEVAVNARLQMIGGFNGFNWHLANNTIIGSNYDDVATDYRGYFYGEDGKDRISAFAVSGGDEADSIRAYVAYGGDGGDFLISAPHPNGSQTFDVFDIDLDSIFSATPAGMGEYITHYMEGGKGNDLLYDSIGRSGYYFGGEGNDIIVSSSASLEYNSNSQRYKSPEVDIITGGLGKDYFWLCGSRYRTPGFKQGPSDPAFGGGDQIRYLQEQDSYAIITDFNSSEGDKIFLSGDRFHYGLHVNYSKGSIVYDDIISTGLYVSTKKKNGFHGDPSLLPEGSPNSQLIEEPDLVAVLLGQSPGDFSLNDDLVLNADASRIGWVADAPSINYI